MCVCMFGSCFIVDGFSDCVKISSVELYLLKVFFLICGAALLSFVPPIRLIYYPELGVIMFVTRLWNGEAGR